MRLSWLALRSPHRPMPGDPIAHVRFKIKMRTHLCWKFSLRRTGRLPLVFHEQPRRPTARSPATTRARPPYIQQKLSIGSSLGRLTVRRRSSHYWLDGSRARPLRPSSLVVAQPPQHPRKAKTVRAHTGRLPNESARALRKQRALQNPEAPYRRACHHHDRFRSPKPALRTDSRRPLLALQPHHSHADSQRSLPPGFLCRVEYSYLVPGRLFHHSRFRAAIYSPGYPSDRKASAGIEIRGPHDAGG